MNRVSISNLLPNMIAAEDVYGLDSPLLISKGTVLTKSTISLLTTYGVHHVLIAKRKQNLPLIDQPIEHLPYHSLSPSVRVQASPEFKRFKEEYERGLKAFQTHVNATVKSNFPLDVDSLYHYTMQILSTATPGISIFDMLQNMQEHDDATFAHSLNVAMLSHNLAKWLGWSNADVKTATICGLFHDIGKLLVPSELIKKPGKLSRDEYDKIRKHPEIGYKLLRKLKAPDEVCQAALMHHERCDGSGYPYHLKAHKISPFAKLTSIADVYDAMTSTRVYRTCICPFTAIWLFESDGILKYEPGYITTFLQNVVSSYLGYHCRLSNGQEGNIIYINRDMLSKPIVKCDEEFIDLALEADLHIDCLL